jgi:hypothetical protein
MTSSARARGDWLQIVGRPLTLALLLLDALALIAPLIARLLPGRQLAS